MSRIERAFEDWKRLNLLTARASLRRFQGGSNVGFICRIDGRAVILTAAVYLCIMLSHGRYTISSLIPFSVYPLILLSLSGIPWRWTLKQLMCIMPFILFMGIWFPIVDREPMDVIFIGKIAAGWIGFATLILRAVLSVTTALGLLGVLGWPGIMRALSGLKIPAIVRIPAELLHRHLFDVLETAGRMLRARELRGGKRMTLRDWSAFCGQLLLRSIAKGERIEQALECRGFVGEWPTLYPSRWSYRDTLWTILWIAFFAGLKWGTLSSLLGKWLLGNTGY